MAHVKTKKKKSERERERQNANTRTTVRDPCLPVHQVPVHERIFEQRGHGIDVVLRHLPDVLEHERQSLDKQPKKTYIHTDKTDGYTRCKNGGGGDRVQPKVHARDN